MVLSWPADAQVRWATTRVDAPIAQATRDGYEYVTITLPAAEVTAIPDDAPTRFRLPPAIRASTFESYAEISSVIAPFFATQGTIEPGGTLAGTYAAPKVEFPLGAKGQIVAFAKEGVGHAGELHSELRHV